MWTNSTVKIFPVVAVEAKHLESVRVIVICQPEIEILAEHPFVTKLFPAVDMIHRQKDQFFLAATITERTTISLEGR